MCYVTEAQASINVNRILCCGEQYLNKYRPRHINDVRTKSVPHKRFLFVEPLGCVAFGLVALRPTVALLKL